MKASLLLRTANLTLARSCVLQNPIKSTFKAKTSSFTSLVFPSSIFGNMSTNGTASGSDLERMKARADLTEKVLADLQEKIKAIKKAAVKEAGLGEEAKLREENAKLKQEIDQVKKALALAEIGNGVRQVFMPTKAELAKFSSSEGESSPVPASNPEPSAKETSAPQAPGGEKGKKNKQENKAGEAGGKKAKQEKGGKGDGAGETKAKKSGGGKPAAGGGGESTEPPVDISRLDMRVGKIVGVEKHPDAESLYVEQVDLGEGRHRTIVSGLVKHVPITAMKDRIAVFMCNLKPAKMRGVLSEGMIMCASSPEKVEILVPPTDAEIGDRVTVDEFPGSPDAQLNPKKKVWETLKPDVRTNSDRVATYKGGAFKIQGKGIVVAPTLANTQIS